MRRAVTRDNSRPLAMLLLGPPGVGKTAPRRKLVQKGFLEIEASAVIREVCGWNPHVKEQVARFKASHPPSALLPDGLMNVILDEKLHRVRTRGNMVIDGFPRTLRQAEHLCDVLMQRRYRFRFTFLNAPDNVCQERACVSRAHEGRPDDVPQIHRERLLVWHRNYPDLRRGLEVALPEDIHDIDATNPIDIVVAQIEQLAI